MARNCNSNLSGSHVYYLDPQTGAVRSLTRGQLLPAGVTRLVARPYGLGLDAPSAEEIGRDDLEGAYVYVVDADGRLVHQGNGPELAPAAGYRRVGADQLLGQLRGHLPSASQAEILRTVALRKRQLQVLLEGFVFPSDEDRVFFEATGMEPESWQDDEFSTKLRQLIGDLESMGWDHDYNLRVDAELVDPSWDEAGPVPTPIDDLLFEARCALSAHHWGVPIADVKAISEYDEEKHKPTRAEIEARDALVAEEALWCVHIHHSIYNDNYYETVESRVESVWPTKQAAEERARAIAIHDSTVDDEYGEIGGPSLCPWKPGDPALSMVPSVTDRDKVPTAPTTYEHGSAWVIYEEQLVTEDYSPDLQLVPVGLYASEGEALAAAEKLGVWEEYELYQVIEEAKAIRSGETWRSPDDDIQIRLKGGHGALRGGVLAGGREADELQCYGIKVNNLVGRTKAAVVAMPISPALPVARALKD